jgi:hypothetical protein
MRVGLADQMMTVLKRPHTDDPRQVTAAVLELLREGLAVMAPAAQVKITGYFNHSFIPSAVITDEQRRRYVDLSLEDPADAWFADHLRYTGGNQAVFLALGGDSDDLAYDLEELDEADGCLIVGTAALNALSVHPSVYTQQVLRHGRGQLTSELAVRCAGGDPEALARILPEGRRDVQLSV